ncbi:DUF3817 domain-containing protein [Luteibaculum oceani]|uniref:DUF3817 domain-containing protein n=1 Tax=Luteibaculum oceani TaxID=1294296 RepID=A0A5C6UWR2_9FLAO|nr:DUF3817 domain-containing protein [Luteibaculum oceani]TXC77104.1 DUF3817 domain-containing protein [Luteibaculum oceani]
MKKLEFSTALSRLRLLALLEGISFLLFAVTIPLKYVQEIPEPNYVVGMIHGVLFIGYELLVVQNWFLLKWKFSTALLAGLAAIVPFGTFVADSKIFKKYSQ